MAGARGAQRTSVVGRELRSIHDRTSRSRVDLAQAVASSAERVKALERVAGVAAARRKQTQEPDRGSAHRNGNSNA